MTGGQSTEPGLFAEWELRDFTSLSPRLTQTETPREGMLRGLLREKRSPIVLGSWEGGGAFFLFLLGMEKEENEGWN